MSAASSDQEPQNVARLPIRVVHLVTTLDIGGLEKVVLDLVRCRTRATLDAHVICLDATGVLERDVLDAGVSVETIGPHGSVPRRILRLARRLKQLRPHVLHTHNPQAHIHGAWAARLANVPVVIHTRHGRGHPERRLTATLNRVASAWTTRYVAVSEDAAWMARDVEHVPDGKLLVIHNGIDLERYSSAGTKPNRTGGRAVTVGRLDPVKDQETMLRAVRLVVDQMPGFQLNVVGDGPVRSNLETLRAALGLADHIHMHGYREQVGPYLAVADFFVLSSISEGVSIALLEAMASGLPAVATNVGGNREVIVPGETGYLVPAGSPEALAGAMLDVLAVPRTLERMGRASRRRVEDQFSLRRMVAQYEGLYFQCLGRTLPKSTELADAVLNSRVG
jgi:sugar transferase (PEP-CTERM/EpsH1 system associated)